MISTAQRAGEIYRHLPAKYFNDIAFSLSLLQALSDNDIVEKLGGIVTNCINESVNHRLDSLNAEIQGLRAKLQEKDSIISDLRKEVHEIQDQYDALEQYGRRSSLRISGISEDYGENTSPAIVKLANETLGLYPPLQEKDIDVSHRLAKPKGAAAEEPRPVIVRCMTRKDRFRVISKRSNLKAFNETVDEKNKDFYAKKKDSKYTAKLYINEDLTSRRASLFTITRNMLKAKHLSQAWTYNGNIKIKLNNGKIESVKNEMDLIRLIPGVELEQYKSKR